MGYLINSYRFAYQQSLTFTTNKNGIFAPSITTSDSSIATWNVNGFASQNTNTPSFTLDGTERLVTLNISDFSKITGIAFNDKGIVGALDLSLLTNCISFDLYLNAELTTIVNPINSANIYAYKTYGCTSLTALDLSTFSNLGGSIYLSSSGYLCPNLASVLLPVSPQAISLINISGTKVASLDLSGLTGLGGSINLGTNTSLTSILFPVSTNTITLFNLANTALTGIIDLSGLTGMSAALSLHLNPNVTNYVIPETDNVIPGITTYGNTSLTGVLDLSMLTHLKGTVYITYSNTPNLSNVIFPNTTEIVTTLNLYNCPSITDMDLTPLVNLRGAINIGYNVNLSNISLPPISEPITIFNLASCPSLTGTLDLSGLTGLGGSIDLRNNSNLSQILFPNQTANISSLQLYGCVGLIGALDLSPLAGLGGSVYIGTTSAPTPLLTDVIFPVASNSFNYIYINMAAVGVLNFEDLSGSTIANIQIMGNEFTSAESDENIVLIDTHINVTASLNIGGSNGALTDGSVTGFDGLAAKDNLISEGVTVTYN